MAMIQGNLRQFLVGETDLTEYVRSPIGPMRTLRLSGYWDGGTITVSGRVRRVRGGFAIDLDAASYQRLTGRRHPRIGRMHRAYRRRTGGWR